MRASLHFSPALKLTEGFKGAVDIRTEDLLDVHRRLLLDGDPNHGVGGGHHGVLTRQKSKNSSSKTPDSCRMMPADRPAVMPAMMEAPLVRPTR